MDGQLIGCQLMEWPRISSSIGPILIRLSRLVGSPHGPGMMVSSPTALLSVKWKMIDHKLKYSRYLCSMEPGRTRRKIITLIRAHGLLNRAHDLVIREHDLVIRAHGLVIRADDLVIRAHGLVIRAHGLA